MLNFHKNHKNLVLTAFLVFLALSVMIAILPAFHMQDTQPLSTQPALTPDETKGLHIYISEGCVACHSQQVRNIAMDKMWGSRPTIAEDFYYSKQRLDIWRQSPSLLGSERTGPDLTNIGKRQSSDDWHLMHLYNPRSVVEASVMPSYPWLFSEKEEGTIKNEERIVNVPEKYYNRPGYKLVANKEALQLVAYLKALKLADLPDGKEVDDFIPSIDKVEAERADAGMSGSGAASVIRLDGANLFTQNCAACHQASGAGIPGAFPSLVGSEIVNNESPEQLITIIIEGYNQLAGYGPMPPLGDQLSDAEIAAIATHERSSWGNNASAVSEEDVKKIREFLKNQ
ncbi:MAG: cbb3-type cytochrome c oxidase subunit II [Balneolaceae bacterium]